MIELAAKPEVHQGWAPHDGPQTFALIQPDFVFEILFGGSRGPGKTDAGLAWISELIGEPRYRGLVIRKNADDLSDWLDRAELMFHHLGVKVTGRPAILRFPSGAKIRTGHMKDDNAYTKYQGHEYQRMLIEELTQIATEQRYLMLISSCRSTVPGLKAQVFNTANPGGVGHAWVRKRFVQSDDPAVHYEPNTPYKDPVSKRLRIFIPATIEDNPSLITNDPDYVNFLESLRDTNEELWKAWRLGDWNIFVGQAFREWAAQKVLERDGERVVVPWHVIDQFGWSLDACHKFITFDWGFSSPASMHWHAITPENKYGVRRWYIYRELYQTQKDPEAWGRDLGVIQKIDPASYIYMPHDTYNREYGDSIAAIFEREANISVRPAKTLERGARKNRKALLHRALRQADDGLPYLQIHSNCRNAIRTIPELVLSETDPEDIDTEGEDHCLVAETPILTTNGWVPIAELDGAKVTGYNEEVLTLTTTDGETLTCTPNHQILTPQGWVEAQDLTPGTLILWLSAPQFKNTVEPDTIFVASIFSMRENAYIESFGVTAMDAYRAASISITKTKTAPITTAPTLIASPNRTTSAIILPNQLPSKSPLGVPMPAGHVERVINDSLRHNAVKQLFSVSRAGKRDKVYDLSIANSVHAFIANGFIVHNCYDDISTGLLMEWPKLEGSGGINTRQKFKGFPKTFTPSPDGDGIQSPDFVSKFKDMGNTKKGAPRF